jgi:hypothetical protein
LLAIANLLYFFFENSSLDTLRIGRQPICRDIPRRIQFARRQICLLALGKAVNEESPVFGSIGDDRAISTRPSLPFASDPLLYQASAQIGVNETSRRPINRLEQTRIGNPFTPGKPRKPLRLVSLHELLLTL